jgi:DNA recombination protein RmuC
MIDTSSALLLAFAAFVIGFGIAYILRGTQIKNGEQLAQRLFNDAEQRRQTNDATLVETLRSQFGVMSVQALQFSTEQLLRLAEERLRSQSMAQAADLDTKKQLIDQQLNAIEERLGTMAGLVAEFERTRAERLGALSSELQELTRTSMLLQQALADNRARGQWGERIAEDVLRLAGFIEGINYARQQTMGVFGSDALSRPDFTFYLPNGMTLNMDVKFPLDNYTLYQAAAHDEQRVYYRKLFLGDVRARVFEIGSRGYVSPEQNTVDCALVFIPNEQIFRFIYETDPTIFDDAMSRKVLLCSPLTLFGVLAVIRQAVEHFRLQQTSRDILLLLYDFRKQWGDYVRRMDDLGKAINRARGAYNELVGRRKRALDKSLSKIDRLMARQADPDAADEDDDFTQPTLFDGK